MNKTITYTAALISVLLFSATAAATPDQETDLLYGNGTVESSVGSPYVWSNSGPIGTETDLLSHLDEVKPTHDATTGERIVVIGEQDNSDDLIYQAS
jgi:hypothetical protein